MKSDDFEGSVVLEKLVEIGKLDEFMEAIDADNFGAAKALMEIADIDEESINIVLAKMNDATGEH